MTDEEIEVVADEFAKRMARLGIQGACRDRSRDW